MRTLIELTVLVCALCLAGDGARAQETVDSRRPFAIELPEINSGLLVEMDVYYPPGVRITRLKLWVLAPYDAEVDYGRIKATLNGKATGTVARSGAGLRGKFLDLDLRVNPDIRLAPGKNVVEITTEDRSGKSYRASFVLLPGKPKPSVAESGFGGRKFAVIIGVSEYKHNEGGLGDLSYAHKDAEAIRDFLKTPNGGNFLDSDILYLVNDQATLATVSDALKRFLTKAGPNDLIYLFLAGHGAPDPYDPQRLYFLLHDTKIADIPNTAFPMDRLSEFLDQQKSQARLICFLDTCHSAGVGRQTQTAGGKSANKAQAGGRGIGAKDVKAKPPGAPPAQSAPNADFNFYNRRLFQEKSWAVIASSGRDETSQESPRWGQGHGVFTWALLEGLRGAADENRDCVVSAGEIFKYVTGRVRRETGARQNPQSLPGANTALAIAATPGRPDCRR